MTIRPALRIVLCITTGFFTCGFTSANSDQCAEATKAAKSLALVVNEQERAAEEERIRALCPGGAADMFIDGLRHERHGETEEAVASYRHVVAADPGFAEAHGNLGVLLVKLGNEDEGSVELTRALIDKPDPRYHRVLADILGRKNLPGLAAFHREQARAASPDDAEAQSRPDDPSAFIKQAEAKVAAGDYDSAIGAYLRAVELKGPGEQLHYSLGVLYERKGMLDEAAEEYLKALQYTPDNGDARRRLADIYSLRGSFAKAAEQYRELLRTRADNPLLHLKLGHVYEMSRKFPEATAEYERALKLDPDNLKAHKDFARLLALRGLHDRAAVQYREVLRLKKDDKETRLALIALYVKKKQYDDLFLLLKESVELHPEDANSHYKLGIIYEFKKDFSSAIGEYEKTVALDQGHAKGLNALGRLYLRTGRIQEAKVTLLAAKKADPALDEPTLLLNRIKFELAPEPVKVTKKVYKKRKAKKLSSKVKGAKKSDRKKPGKKTVKKINAKKPVKKKASAKQRLTKKK